jgi:hypothetical protein
MGPLTVITPTRIYMDILVTYGGIFCVVRPNMELNKQKPTQKELAFAHRYLVEEGWLDYATGNWKPDPELCALINEMIEIGH